MNEVIMDETKSLIDSWAARWNEKYSKEEFVYGEEPNSFLKEQLAKIPVGSILFPAEGEGRNSVYAAKIGWKATAFDISSEGRAKALRLAEKNNVTIDYKVGTIETMNFPTEQFDAIALIYAHFPANKKSVYYQTLDKYLKTGGLVIFEAFSKNHIDFVTANEKIGGPRDVGLLFSTDEIRADFANYEIIELEEKEVELNEGLFHNGTGSVIRFVGRKRIAN